ncbi:MAG TPA: hypothetical protein VNA16_03960 [Abditibacteriaceae bacterium]|nr:hypothetical protein [Abditibacteriaceae bacterium]
MSDAQKHTSDKAASAASDVLRDGRTSSDSKAAAGSALSQASQSTDKSTSEEAAAKASNVLQSDDTSDKSKTAAASALSQKESSS